jgi:hypothetical protein
MRYKVLAFGFLAFLTATSAFAVTPPDYIKANALELNGLRLPKEAISNLLPSHLLLIGDYHGTNEIPQIVYSIVEQLASQSKLRIGFEFPVDIADKVALFMKTGDRNILRQTQFFRDSTYHSGKGSSQMIALLDKLRGLANAEIFCFDVPNGDSSDSAHRETKLAKNVLKAYRMRPDARTIIYTGNLHSRITKGAPWDPNYPTMGSEIIRLSTPKDGLKSISSVLVRPGSGSAFICKMQGGKIQCGPTTMTSSNADYFSTLPYDYFLKEPGVTDGHTFSLILHKITASMPF